MTTAKRRNATYYFIDIDCKSRQLIGWGSEQKDKLEVRLKMCGYQRVFLTKGQYNKLIKDIESAGK